MKQKILVTLNKSVGKANEFMLTCKSSLIKSNINNK